LKGIARLWIHGLILVLPQQYFDILGKGELLIVQDIRGRLQED
jgi:hypothetical protein